MKQSQAKITLDVLQKIENIEKEVMDLKLSVLKRLSPTGKKASPSAGSSRGLILARRISALLRNPFTVK